MNCNDFLEDLDIRVIFPDTEYYPAGLTSLVSSVSLLLRENRLDLLSSSPT